MLFNKEEIEQAAERVYQFMPPTAQYVWPQISDHVGTEVWVKHENHTPTGAFKVRGGITFMDWLVKTRPDINGIVTATRGNHGQSQARAASAQGLKTKIIVPVTNSVEKNAAMASFGGEVIKHGKDFNEAVDEANRVARDENLFVVPPFHKEIIRGVSSYALELFSTAQDLDTVYVPIGCGSGICSLITTRDALGLKTKIVGVVSSQANAAKKSFETGIIEVSESAQTFADGMAVRVPVKEAFDIYSTGAERIVDVSDEEVAHAMRLYFKCTHNVVEGAGAASLAAALQEKERNKGKKIAVIVSGGNIDTDQFIDVLAGKIPTAK